VAVTEADQPWPAPAAAGRLAAVVTLPGSKSQTNRALVLAALSESPTRIGAPLIARDSMLMMSALGALGVPVTAEGPDLLVRPAALQGGPVDCGLAGTVMRFVPPLAALAAGDSSFDGDPAARLRPMDTLIEALRQAGAQITDDGTGRLPFTVHGAGDLPGGVVELDFSASSQFVSALLLAGSRFESGVDIRHVGPELPSLPHVQMTVAAVRSAGGTVDVRSDRHWRVAPGTLDLPDEVIEPDLSSAAPFLAAALVTGGSVTVPHWPAETTQPGAVLPELLTRMGATAMLDERGLTVLGSGSIGPLEADLHEASELTPVIAALCALADGECRISGVAHIRGHETDRLAALRNELGRLGAAVTETADGLVIRPAALRSGCWHAYADHRMAQAGALLGLAVAGLTVDDIGCTSKTLADFPGLWAAMLDQSS